MAIAVVGLGSLPAHAAQEPSRTEARAIKKSFLEEREGKTIIRKILVSTVDPDYAAVSYKFETDSLEAMRASARRTSHTKTYTPSVPAVLKKVKGGKWKTVPKVPTKVKKDLKYNPVSNIRLSGDVSAFLTQPASCTMDRDFYSASVYDAPSDTYLSIQINRFHGFGRYPALAVRSLAALSVGNKGTVPQYETGQPNDAESPSGEIWADATSGVIEATMSPTIGQGGSGTVSVSGTWGCR